MQPARDIAAHAALAATCASIQRNAVSSIACANARLTPDGLTVDPVVALTTVPG
jgi:hypothetical protein